MSIPTPILALIDRLNQQVDEIETDATTGLNLVRQFLSLFGDNAILIQYVAYLNAALLFVETSRRQIQTTVELISADEVTFLEIQEAGEDLGTLLGRALETKITVVRIITSLSELS